MSYNNIGVIYQNSGEIEQAIEYHQMSLKLRNKIGNAAGVAMSYTNIGVLRAEQDNYQQAIEYLEHSVEISRRIDYKVLSSHNYKLLARIYIDLYRENRDLSEGNIEKSMGYTNFFKKQAPQP